MRALFTTQPGIGHYRPLVPFARALERAGHSVSVACAPRFHHEVEKTGFRCVAAGFDYLLGEVTKAFPDMPPPGPLRPAKMLALWRGDAAIAMARDLVAMAKDLAPDVIVHEGSELGACIAAERIGIPHVTAGALWFRPELAAPTDETIRRFELEPDAVGHRRAPEPRRRRARDRGAGFFVRIESSRQRRRSQLSSGQWHASSTK
jgi:hypothetical protein